MHPQFTTEAPIVEPIAAWITVFPAFLALGLTLFGLVSVRRHLRISKSLSLVLLVAVLVRLVWLPVGLHQFDGHEAEYRDIFLGDKSLTRGSAMLYPALQWLYAGLGRISQSTRLLLSVSLLSSLVSIAATYGIGRRLRNERVGLAAAALLALWGNHAFWASSAYNVAFPLAAALASIWALLVLAQESEKPNSEQVGAAALAGGAAALAVATRMECVLLAPVGIALFLTYRGGVSRGGISRGSIALLGLGAILSLWSLYAILSAGPLPGGERSLALQNNLFFWGYWAPFGGWAALCILPAVVLVWRKSRQYCLVLVGFLLLLHVGLSTFNDVGFRHTLLGSWALALVLAHLVEVRWGWAVLVVVGLALAVHTQDVAERYYMSEEDFAATLTDAPEFDPANLSECVLICEDRRVVLEGQQRSHFNLLDPVERDRIFDEKGCIYWLFGLQDARWSSRAVRDRSLRLGHLFDLQSLGRITRPGGYVGSVFKLSR